MLIFLERGVNLQEFLAKEKQINGYVPFTPTPLRNRIYSLFKISVWRAAPFSREQTKEMKLVSSGEGWV
jgi:hypothetical protein